MSDNTKTQGLAKAIRCAPTSEQFDLAGYEKGQLQDLASAAFVAPIGREDMIRCTFLIGGGKLCRQKYYEAMGKDFSEALRSIGYEEDRGASCSLQCQGTFKYQHDTDKNIKMMHVFPRVDPSLCKKETDDDGFNLSKLSPAYLSTVCTTEIFHKMVAAKARSMSQKRQLLSELKEVQKRFATIDEKMMSGERLSEQEQDLYDQSSSEVMAEKVEHLTKELETMVADGLLTAKEKKSMMAELQKKKEDVEEKLAAAKQDDSLSRKVSTFEKQLAFLKEKITHISSINPVVHKGKNHEEIKSLKEQIAALDKIGGGKKLLSQDEVQKLLTKPGFEVRLKTLEEEDRGWYQ